jgi:AAA15 family ATPase/GTPase
LLLRFGIENFRSIGEYQEFSMISDSAIKDRVDTLIETKAPSVREPLLTAAVIYGANASGKSNLLRGFEYIRHQLLYSHSDIFRQRGMDRQPFRLDQSFAGKPTKCDVDFIWKDVRYHYGFEAMDEEFVAEWLYDFPSGRRRILFERNGPLPSDVTFGSSNKANVQELAKFMRPDSLLASVAVQNNFADTFPVALWARGIIFEMTSATISRFPRRVSHSRLLRNEKIDQRITQFLEIINTGISDFDIVDQIDEPTRTSQLQMTLGENPASARNSEKSKKLFALHKSIDGELVYFDINEESSGTQRMLVLLDIIFNTLDRGTVLVIDEMDSSLHTLVGQKVLDLFMNKRTNPSGAQLLVTTHDTNVMGHDGLRRDQIWFTEKDKHGATHLFPLTNFKARKGQNVEKGYLEGRFGAIPYSGDISRFIAIVDDQL